MLSIKRLRVNTTVIVLFCALFIASIGINLWFWNESNSVRSYLDEDTYQSQLNNLLEENMVLLINAVKSSNTDKNDYNASVKALNNNTLQMAQWIGNIYGSKAADKFQNLWDSQTNDYLQYAYYSEKEDATNSVKYNSVMTKFPTTMTQFFTQLNPKTNQSMLKQLFNSNVAVTKTIIDTHVVKDSTTFYMQQHDALVLVNEIASTINKDAAAQNSNKIK